MSTEHLFSAYLKGIDGIRSTGGGTEEESYYASLENLLNAVGLTLKPEVKCVAQLKNTGAGEPDFGLYSGSQLQSQPDAGGFVGTLPERGVVEVKPWTEEIDGIIKSDQIRRYSLRYGLVIVCNYREFAMVSAGEDRKLRSLERFVIAASAEEFQVCLASPIATVKRLGDRLLDFLRRALTHVVPLRSPEDVAWLLASYAREAKCRVEVKQELPALTGLRSALEQALGLKFDMDKGQQFFIATLVQTLFYGVFSSWVLWSRNGAKPGEKFNWHEAGWLLHVPFISTLFSQIATRDRLKPLALDEVLDWTAQALNRIEQTEFFKRFEDEHAVQYFYEPFLKAYDPQLRKELGVWYTPPEIVKYQVERVDAVLREELEIADGLADPNVYVLDPCCGTGAYLVEALRKIVETLKSKGKSGLSAQKLKLTAMRRVFGFELLPAPFVVSHLQLGLLLQREGAPLDPNSDERVGVYLTNALTGWEPVQEPKDQLELTYPELSRERDAANEVKQSTPILVVIGNPPYNAFAGISPEEEGGLVEVYKNGLTTPEKDGGWGIKKFNLDDLYVRFFRIAERRIVKTGRGVVSFISNYSYLSDPSFVAMRQHLLREFDSVWIDCMNGDSRETGKLTPEGRPDPSVFSFAGRVVGIRVGTAVCLMVRKKDRSRRVAKVRYRDFWGIGKNERLLESASQKRLSATYSNSKPEANNRYSFRPVNVDKIYLSWPRVIDLCEVPPSNGLMEKRGGALFDIDKHSLSARIRRYLDKRISWDELIRSKHPLALDAARFDAAESRSKLLSVESFHDDRIVRYAVRPFDSRWAYYSGARPLWNEPRPAYWAQCWPGNRFFMTRFRSTAVPEGVPCFAVTGISDDHFIVPDNACFPMRLKETNGHSNHVARQQSLEAEFDKESRIRANYSERARRYLSALGIRKIDTDVHVAELLWLHCLAVGFSPLYLKENADGIRGDWLRMPLPKDQVTLLSSALLGERVAQLLNTEIPISGVTSGKLNPIYRRMGLVRHVEGKEIDPLRGELDLTAGWGRLGKDDACMPGKGLVVVRSTKDTSLRSVLGATVLDVFLNRNTYWSNVPEAVWEFYIGGYQVIKKWLSYREKTILGRGLSIDEAEYVTEMTRRIAALIVLQRELDDSYRSLRDDCFTWGQT